MSFPTVASITIYQSDELIPPVYHSTMPNNSNTAHLASRSIYCRVKAISSLLLNSMQRWSRSRSK